MKLTKAKREYRRLAKEHRNIRKRWRTLRSQELLDQRYSTYYYVSMSRFIRRRIRLEQMDESGLFLSTNIETFGACNRTCSFCFNHERFEKRNLGVMNELLWRKIIDEFSALRFAGRLSPYFYGEPLLDKRIVKLIAYAHRKCPLAFIQVNTNGDYLDEATLRNLIVCGVDRFVVTNYDDTPKPALEALQKDYRPWVDYRHYTDFEIQNRAGELFAKTNPREDEPCLRPSSQLVMNWDGEVALCCNDFYAQHSIGNARDSDVLSIWQNERFTEFRNLLEKKGGRKKIDFCAKCDMYAPKKVR